MSEIEHKACHNCRRKRLKCDRNVPSCYKCVQRGYECSGYQSLFRWGQGMASRGKLRGVTFESLATMKERPINQKPGLSRVIADPLLQDLCYDSRIHVSYFATNVCRDLVLHDDPYSNPFRALIPLTQAYPCLLQILIANSALHMSNASEGHLAISSTGSSNGRLQRSPRCNALTSQGRRLSQFTLTAKQRALRLLNLAICKMGLEDLDGILATVLLFVQFEIMDSGQTQWKCHIRGARSLIDMAYKSGIIHVEHMSALRRCLISNCLVYDIFGTTFTTSEGLVPNNTVLNGALSLLQDAEGNHCSSFPMPLLCLIHEGVLLSRSDDSYEEPSAFDARDKQAQLILESARAFDPYKWAASVQIHTPHPDLTVRTRIACAHQAAACIYLIRILFRNSPPPQILQTLESLASETQSQLSSISPNDPIIAATAWPAFIAGAEASDNAMENWARDHFQHIWVVQPWGLIKGAIAVLQMLWARRRRDEQCDDTRLLAIEDEEDWIMYMKRIGSDWLIL